MAAVFACPPETLATFVATSGEALVSIAERLVDDVLFVMDSPSSLTSGGATSSRGSHAAGASTHQPNSRTSGTKAAGRGKPTSTVSASSSTSMKHPWYGSGNPGVTLEHRLAWARSAVSILAAVSVRLPKDAPQTQQLAGEDSAVDACGGHRVRA